MKNKKTLLPALSLLLIMMIQIVSFTPIAAQSNETVNVVQSPSMWILNPFIYLVGGIFVILLFVILGLAKSGIGLSKAVSQLNKKFSITVLWLSISAAAFAQTDVVAERPVAHFPEWAKNPDLYALALLFIILLITIFVLLGVNLRLIKAIVPATSPEKVSDTEVAAVEKKPTFLRRIYLRLVDSVPVEQEKDVLLDHNYDGIKELDNNLPPWWKYGFYVTIVFAFLYLLNYHVFGTGKLQAEEYKDELLLAQKQKEERFKMNAENINEENVVLLTDAEAVSKGKETYTKLCSACHRADAGGQVGPNLTDEYWIHGGGIKNVFKTITYGVPNKGMISWQSQLSPKQIQHVASYVLSLKGSNPQGPKEPQGDKWIDENAAPADSTVKSKNDSSLAITGDILKK